jgi:hypothetical protein
MPDSWPPFYCDSHLRYQNLPFQHRSDSFPSMSAHRHETLERIDIDVSIVLHRKREDEFRFRIGPVSDRKINQQGTLPMALILTDVQHAALTLEADDAAGNPVSFNFPSPPTWSSSDPTVLTVNPSADGSSADIATTGKLGGAQVSVSGTDADGAALTGLLDVTVVTSKATTFKIVAGTPTDK